MHCFYFLLQMQTCLFRAKSLQKQDQTDPRTPQTQPQPDKCPLGRPLHKCLYERKHFPTLLVDHDPLPSGKLQEGWTRFLFAVWHKSFNPLLPRTGSHSCVLMTNFISFHLYYFISYISFYSIYFILFHFTAFLFILFYSFHCGKNT